MGALLEPVGRSPVVSQHGLVLLPEGCHGQSLEGGRPRSSPLLDIRKCRENAALQLRALLPADPPQFDCGTI